MEQKDYHKALATLHDYCVQYNQLVKVRKYCSDNGWKVIFRNRHEDAVDVEAKTISINSCNTPETQLYRLLHEIGHILVSQEKDYYERFPKNYDSEKNLKLLRNRIKVLSEEVNAWDQAYQFTKQHNIKINIRNFDNCKAKCLKTFVKWIMNYE